MKRKFVYLVDGILILISLFALFFVGGSIHPMVVSPLDGFNTSESFVLFSIENAQKILIDEYIDFPNPKEYSVKEGLKIELEPGEYYWQAINSLGIKSEVKRLTIISHIDLKVEESSEGYFIVNGGNTRLNVDVYNDSTFLENFNLVPDGKTESFGNKFFARWKNE